MRKRRMFIVTLATVILVSGSLVYASGTEFSLKRLYNASGEEVYYPETESKEPTAQEVSENDITKQKYAAPETAEIGDVFLGEEGYERVIAVSEDGAFVTEGVSAYGESHEERGKGK